MKNSSENHANGRNGRAEPIAIVGMSCLFPKAQSLQEYWSNIKNRVDAIREVPESHWRPDEYFDGDPKRADHTYCRRGGFLDPVEFDPVEYGISPKSIEATDTAQLLSLIVAQGAMADAGYSLDREFNRERISVILGVTGTLELAVTLGGRLGHPIWRRELEKAGVHPQIAEEVVRNIGDSYVAWQEDSFPGLLGNVVAGRIANRFNLGGTNCVVDAACASSISAVHLAALELESGRSDMVITGGVDAFNDIFMYMCFSKTPALSPTGDSRPFDASADGTILGEGVGMVVLKRLSDAERDGDRVYAVIKGVGSSSDGRGKAIYAPSAAGQVRALRNAYEQAGVSPATIELVESHGTGTKVGDATEVTALKEVYRDSGRSGSWCALGSVKSQIGHTKAAAGVAGLIKAALALTHKVLPPTIKVDEPNAAVEHGESPFYVSTQKRPWMRRVADTRGGDHPRRAAVSSFGFGGSNFHMVMEEHGAEKQEIDWDGRVEIVALSAQNVDDLKTRLRSWASGIEWADLKREAAQSRRDFKSSDPYRLLLVLERDKVDLKSVFKKHLESIERLGGQKSWSTPDGAYFGGPRKVGKLGFLFPGQGSQYVGMGLDLACLFPKMQEVLTQADLAYGDMTDLARQLTDFIFPLPVFNEEARKLNEMALRATQRAQPAIGAISMGAICVLAMFGVHPAAAAGHSFGELVALFTGGRINSTALHHLSQLRGHLMAQLANEAGAMLAVQAALEEVERIKAEEKLDVVVANINAPNQIVISGARPEVERAASAFRERKLPNTLLPVSAAFHSPLVAEAQAPFRAELDKLEFGAATVPVYANATGGQYPADVHETRELLGRQLTSPVQFVRLIENMHADGVTTFVEVGPGARLTGLVNSILGNREYAAFAIDASSGRNDGIADLAKTLAQLGALGHDVDLKPWQDGEALLNAPAKNAKQRMTVEICGANYRAPRKNGDHHAVPPIQTVRNEMNPPPISNPEPEPSAVAVPKSAAVTPPDLPPKIAAAGPPPAAGAFVSPSLPSSASSKITAQPNQPQSSGALNPAALGVSDPLLSEALRRTQESLHALQDLQAKTAQLHRQFLEGQERAQQTYQWLLQQQQSFFVQALGGTAQPLAPPPMPSINRPETMAPAGTVEHGSTANLEAFKAPVPQPSPSQSAVSELTAVLLEVVSDKTGYPSEMLNLDMDMESDLGIDSIKRVEILSAVQERLPEAPVVQPEELGRLRTLRQVIEFISAGTADSDVQKPDVADEIDKTDADSPETVITSVEAGEFHDALLHIVSDKTGYPPEMLNLEMDMESDLGIDSIKRVEILSALQERFPDAPVVQPEDVSKLRTLAQVIAFVSGGEATAAPVEVSEPSAPDEPGVPEIEASAPVAFVAEALPPEVAAVPQLRRGVLEKLHLPRRVDGEPLEPPSNSIIAITEDGSGLAERLLAQVVEKGFRPMLLSASERPEIPAPRELAGLIILAPAPTEADAHSEHSERWLKHAFSLVQWASRPLRANVGSGDTFLATVSRLDGAFGLLNWNRELDPIQGGLAGLAKTAWHEWPDVSCRAIDVAADWEKVDEIAAAILDEILHDGPQEIGLTPSGRWTLQVADTPLPVSGDAVAPLTAGDVVIVSGGARGVTAEAALALAIEFKPTLVLLGRSPAPTPEPSWLKPLEEESEIKKAILIRGNGSIGSPKLLEDEFRRLKSNREILRNLARIEAAGSKAVYRQADVTDPAQVARVIDDVRREFGPVRGLVHGAGVLADRRIEDKTGEQFDLVYDTKVRGLRALLDATRGDDLKLLVLFSSVSGRYGRSGQADYAMANESLNKIAHQQARQRPNCRVVAINWGPWDGGMVSDGLKKVFRTEGVGLIPLDEGARYMARELSAGAGPVEVVISAEAAPMPPANGGNGSLSAVRSTEQNGKGERLSVAFKRELNLERHPYLRSHTIGSRPVVPIAMMIEWFAHGALHENPGFVFAGLDEFKVYRPVAVEEGAVVSIQIHAAKARGRASQHAIRAELRSGPAAEVLHASATVHVVGRLPVAETHANGLHFAEPFARTPEALYREVLFHGDHFAAIRNVEGCSEDGIAAEAATAAPPNQWTPDAPRSAWIADPLAIDAALQLGIVWTTEQFGMPSLPSAIASYRQYRPAYPADGVRVVARGQRHGTHGAALDVDLLDRHGALVGAMRGCEFVMDASLVQAFRAGTNPEPVNA